jgi:hypothetical protein
MMKGLMNPIKKQLLTAAIAVSCSLAAISLASAQTDTFSYNDGVGTANAGTYTPGSSFTFSIMLNFAPGGSIANLEGLSYWFTQQTASPYISSITLRDATGSPFSDLQTPSLTYPQALNPTNANDLGGSTPDGSSVGAGNYFIANVTVTISTSAPDSGTFVISDNTTGGKKSVISDSFGDTFAIPEADYTITMVPEPATWAGAALALFGILVLRRRAFRSQEAA